MPSCFLFIVKLFANLGGNPKQRIFKALLNFS